MNPWLLVPGAYLLGSISVAYWAGRINGKDLREHGSGNLGATNAGRVLGGRWFALVFLADLLKGLVPVLLARLIAPHDPWPALACAAAVVLGHVFTCFHGFKGGKAVATALGVLMALVPLVAACTAGVWLTAWLIGWLAFGLGRSGSVGPASVLASAACPTAQILLAGDPWGADLAITSFLLLLATLVIVKHRSNIAKLLGRAD